jgi:hypothetical protein
MVWNCPSDCRLILVLAQATDPLDAQKAFG